MGPFALMNLTGPPIALHSTDYLAEQLHCPRYLGAANLRKMVEEGGMWDIVRFECSDEAAAIIRQRLMGQVFAVSSQIVEEEICSMEDVDRGAKVGLRWALGPSISKSNRDFRSGINGSILRRFSGFNLPSWFAELTQP